MARLQNGISSGLSGKSFLVLLQSYFLRLPPLELHEIEKVMSLPARQENHPSSVQQSELGPVLLEAIKQLKEYSTKNFTWGISQLP